MPCRWIYHNLLNLSDVRCIRLAATRTHVVFVIFDDRKQAFFITKYLIFSDFLVDVLQTGSIEQNLTVIILTVILRHYFVNDEFIILLVTMDKLSIY